MSKEAIRHIMHVEAHCLRARADVARTELEQATLNACAEAIERAIPIEPTPDPT